MSSSCYYNYRRHCDCHTPWQRIKRICEFSLLESGRFMIVIGSVMWVLLLIVGAGWFSDVHLFDPKRTTYRLMALLADEDEWALAFAIHAGFGAYTLCTGKRSWLLFFGDCVLGAVLWTLATVACFASHFVTWATYLPPAAMSAEVALMFASWWYAIRWLADKHD